MFCYQLRLGFQTSLHDIVPLNFFFFFPQEHSPSVFITLYLRLVGGKSTVDTTSPLLTSNTLLQSWTWSIYNIQYHQRKEYFIEKMYPSECGRALKYTTCKGKNGSSIIPKRDAEKWKLFYQPYYHKHQKYYAEGTTIVPLNLILWFALRYSFL